MRQSLIGLSLALLLPMSTLTVAQEGVANTYFYNKSTSAIIYRVTGQWRPDIANAIDEVLEYYPEIDRDKFLAMIYQESSFSSTLVQHGDWGLTQIHLSFWRDRYMLDESNILDEKVNLIVGAHIWLTYAGQDYAKYNGTKKNLRLYNKKLKEIKG